MKEAARRCILRAATAADREAIAAVWHASASLPDVGPPAMPTLRELRQRLDAELAAGWAVTVAVQDGAVVGFVALKPAECILAELFVRPDAIGGGLGQALLDHAKQAMPDGFTLYTRPANVRACRFYERAGLSFLRYGTHPRTGEPTVYYHWKGR
ncbi:GNAT family N-acetyltransferase [Aureimonas leprariae]|uniref:GNAT family N-acetyltransferase n=1 Tax=Plantimonas leprariae TaxID=2615207 RepID=A0A7V7PPU8_9HYPH|nr:GNAT family N-acetyltransferase [Aureimonas leprariae]KAB0680027.1 GNAT family N-acetyltransferase [Aureimonas leprariae]